MKYGKVYLVGAGPGDESLITIKGLNAIKEAEVIVYDRLANPELLNHSTKNPELIYVGKASKDHTMTQENISQLLVDKAKEGKIVVRLKGGDPYVFGRGGEEGELLYDNKIEFEVIPGITSGIGGLAYAGIPITHRGHASSLHLITGHLKSEEDELNYEALAKLDGTLVFYMGVSNAKFIVKGLLKEGKNPSTPVAIVSLATLPEQSTFITDLKTIDENGLPSHIKPPSLIAIGTTIALRDKLNFFEKKPLHSKKIVVTRARAQSSLLVSRLKDLGARVIECPSIKISPVNEELLAKEINELKDYTHIIFTSQNAVNIFMENLMKVKDIRAISHLKIGVVGSSTAKELLKYSLKADILPERFIAESLADEMKKHIDKSSKILIPCAEGARNVLKETLGEICEVKEVKIYKNEIEVIGDEIKDSIDDKVDFITFTSSSTVNHFYSMLDDSQKENIKRAKLVSIGPITSNTLKDNGFTDYIEAEKHDIEGVVNAILNEVKSHE